MLKNKEIKKSKIKKILSLGILVLISTSIFSGTEALNSSIGKTIENFQEQEIKLLFGDTPLGKEDGEELFNIDKKLRVIYTKKSRLEKSIKVYSTKYKRALSKQINTTQEVLSIKRNIASKNKKIQEIEKKIQEKNSEIRKIIKDITKKQEEIKTNEIVIQKYVAYIYENSDMLYDKDNNINDIQTFVLSDKSISETIDNVYFEQLIKKGADNFIKHHKILIEELYNDKVNIIKERVNITKLKNRLEQVKKELLITKKENEELLEIIKGNSQFFKNAKELRQTNLNKLLKEENTLTKEYTNIFNKIKKESGCETSKKISCDVISDYYTLENTIKSDNKEVEFIWPIEPIRGVSSFFHDEGYKEYVGADHLAIDIRASQSTPVKASERGYVSYILPPTKGGYSFMAIRHPSGYTSVYGHMSKINVKLFQKIKAGDIIGLSGGQVGTPGAGPATSGPHLHFEMFYGMNRIDPLKKIDILKLKYDELFDSRENRLLYYNKFNKLSERVQKSIKFQKFNLKGKTEKERQINLLKTYATKSFQERDNWVQVGVKYDIDPSFLMCIGLAETTLGNQLKSGFNVGNIGNNDSGDTQSFLNAYSGIELIGKTLNNKYLKQYYTMDYLSRWGNKDNKKPIYASDPINWQKNINKCLGAIKGYPVSDSFRFRLRNKN